MQNAENRDLVIAHAICYGRPTFECDCSNTHGQIVAQSPATWIFAERAAESEDAIDIFLCGLGVASIGNPIVDFIQVAPGRFGQDDPNRHAGPVPYAWRSGGQMLPQG